MGRPFLSCGETRKAEFRYSPIHELPRRWVSDCDLFVAPAILLVWRHEVPAVHAVSASVGHRIPRLELRLRVGQKVAGAAAVHADDGRRRLHDAESSSVDRDRCHDGLVRIVAGTARGRRLASPDDHRGGSSIRPTTDRVRESVFNALHSRGAVVDARVLDLFAGTGALGIEALSRGAAHATFVEWSIDAVALIKANLEVCGLMGQARVVHSDGLDWLAAGVGGTGAAAGPWDLVLLDPPYDFDGWDDLLAMLEGLMAINGVVVVESDHEVDTGTGWHVDSSRRAAGTVVTLLRPESDPA